MPHGGVLILRKQEILNFNEISYLYILLHPLQELIPAEFDLSENRFLVDMISYDHNNNVAVFFNMASNCFELYELAVNTSDKNDSPRTPPRKSHIQSKDLNPSLKLSFKSKTDFKFSLNFQWTSPALPIADMQPNMGNTTAFVTMNVLNEPVLCMV